MFTFKVATHHTNGGRTTLQEIEINVPLQNHKSPIVMALNKLEEATRLNRKQKTHTLRLKSVLEQLCLSLQDIFGIPLIDHTRESFSELLRTVEHAISKRQKSPTTRCAEWQAITGLLRLNHQPMGDGTHVGSCLKAYVTGIRSENPLIKNTALQKLAVISHESFEDLENKAIRATENLLNDVIRACENDIDEYLRICHKHDNFTRYNVTELINSDMRIFFKFTGGRKIKKFRASEILKAISILMSEEETFKFKKDGQSADLFFPSAYTVSTLKGFKHYLYGSSSQPWWFSRYRLPNYVLTSCFLLLLAKTGWNIASVGSLASQSIKKLSNGSYELQSEKHKTNDDTPKYVVSKSDKYLKICISLLTWNHSQLIKYKLLKPSDENLWYGWQRSYATPFYPLDPRRLDTFFSRHNISPIPPSEIRPIKSSLNFLKYHDLEIVRLLLGHSSIETTNLYLKNNLIFHLNESRILEFQRRVENTIARETSVQETFDARGFTMEKVQPNLIGRTPDKDTDIEVRFLIEAKSFLSSIGIKSINEDSIVTIEALKQVALLRNYYRLRWRHLFDQNPRHFAVHHINIMLYIHAFIRVAKERKPLLVESVLSDLGAKSIE